MKERIMGWRALLAIAVLAVVVVGLGASLALPPQLGEAISASEAATLRGGKCYADNKISCDQKVGKCTIGGVESKCDVYTDLHKFFGDGDKQPDGTSRYCCGTLPRPDDYQCGILFEKPGVKCATTAIVVVVGVQ
jgi:hypothetical protein